MAPGSVGATGHPGDAWFDVDGWQDRTNSYHVQQPRRRPKKKPDHRAPGPETTTAGPRPLGGSVSLPAIVSPERQQSSSSSGANVLVIDRASGDGSSDAVDAAGGGRGKGKGKPAADDNAKKAACWWSELDGTSDEPAEGDESAEEEEAARKALSSAPERELKLPVEVRQNWRGAARVEDVASLAGNKERASSRPCSHAPRPPRIGTTCAWRRRRVSHVRMAPPRDDENESTAARDGRARFASLRSARLRPPRSSIGAVRLAAHVRGPARDRARDQGGARAAALVPQGALRRADARRGAAAAHRHDGQPVRHGRALHVAARPPLRGRDRGTVYFSLPDTTTHTTDRA